MSTEKACGQCRATARELRPYGPGGTWICFPCATSTPEREAATRAGFLAQLHRAEQAAGPGGVVAFGDEAGPHVLKGPSDGE